MKAWIFIMSILAAAGLSAAVVMFAILQIKTVEEVDEVGLPVHEDPRLSLFPEQHRAVDDLMAELMARQEQLDEKEKKITEREAQVRQEEMVLMRLRDELTATKFAIEEQFEVVNKEDRANIRKLAEFYARMEPDKAASLLMEQEQDVAARILSQLQDRQAGAIMNAAVALGDNGIERAAMWSESIRKIRNERSNP